jgi:purine-binding chemotaxis protein CheW
MTPPVPSGTVDWTALHERLARAAAAAEQALDPAPERARQIMDQRARILARAPPAARPAGDHIEVLVFSLAGGRYAIETRYVREVVRIADVTPVPGVSDFVVGVTTLRGEILAVVDLCRIFGVEARSLTAHMILCGEQRAEFGVLADNVHDVTPLPLAEIFESPGGVSGSDRAYLRGVTRDALVVLDGAVLLWDERFFISGAQASAKGLQGA